MTPIQLTYIVLCVGFAYWNAHRIARDKRIYHGLNGLAHLACWVAIGLIEGWSASLLTLPLAARVAFDWPLNLFRGLEIDYVPLEPKSLADKAEKFVFKMDGFTPKLIYLFIILYFNLKLND